MPTAKMNNSDIISSYRRTPSPFREAVREFKRRLAWVLSIEGITSANRLRRLKDRFNGQSAIICCNGPSLNSVDLESLSNTYTFGLNKIYLKYPHSRWRPSAIVAINPLVLEQAADQYNEMDTPLFMSINGQGTIRNRTNVHFLYPLPGFHFSLDASIGVCEGYTVTYVAMQLAYYFGFRQVGLVGCDHRFAQTGPSSTLTTTKGVDASHFAANYFAHGIAWQLPDLEGSEFAYRLAKDAFEADGRSLVNCTDGGDLELLPRVNLTDFLKR